MTVPASYSEFICSAHPEILIFLRQPRILSARQGHPLLQASPKRRTYGKPLQPTLNLDHGSVVSSHLAKTFARRAGRIAHRGRSDCCGC